MGPGGSNSGVVACFAVALITLTGYAQVPTVPEPGQQALDKFLSQVVRDTHVPGLVALVSNRAEAIYAGAFGSQDVAQARPMTVDSIFRIASMTKPITSAAVMILIEDGELELDDPVSNYLPGRLPGDAFGLGFQITAEHDSPAMRSPGSLSWAGINNTQFWIDPEAGIGAVLLMQYLPFYDEIAIEALQGFEERLYTHIQ